MKPQKTPIVMNQEIRNKIRTFFEVNHKGLIDYIESKTQFTEIGFNRDTHVILNDAFLWLSSGKNVLWFLKDPVLGAKFAIRRMISYYFNLAQRKFERGFRGGELGFVENNEGEYIPLNDTAIQVAKYLYSEWRANEQNTGDLPMSKLCLPFFEQITQGLSPQEQELLREMLAGKPPRERRKTLKIARITEIRYRRSLHKKLRQRAKACLVNSVKLQPVNLAFDVTKE